MKKFLFLCLLFFASLSYADIPTISLDTMTVSHDKDSIRRGAKFFAANCMSCHTLIYLRYDKLAQEAGITYDKMPINVKWTTAVKPPDLSLVADVRGADWIYTYLHSFYLDPKSITGFNNLLVANSKMPGIVSPYQGQQILATDLRDSRTLTHEWQWYDVLTLQSKGSMTPLQFDDTTMDVINFLVYAAEPFHQQQVNIGRWVILYLLILLVFVYLLKREYWKDLH